MAVKYRDKEEVLLAIKNDGEGEYGYPLKYSSQELRNDKEVVLASVKRNAFSLQYASEELRNDKKVVFKATRINGFTFRYASQELKNDREFVMQVVKGTSFAFRYASEELRNDKEIFLEATKTNDSSLEYAGEELRNDKTVVLEAVRKNAYMLRYTSEELRNDKEVVLEAVNRIGKSLKYASKELQNDKQVVLAALKSKGNEGLSWDFEPLQLARDLQNDKEIVLEAVKISGKSLKYATEELKNDREVVLEALQQKGFSLKFASKELQRDDEIVLLTKLHKVRNSYAKKISDNNHWMLDTHRLEDILVMKEKLDSTNTRDRKKLKKLIEPFFKRSDIEFELKMWDWCIIDLLLSYQLSKLVKETPDILEVKEMILKKFHKAFEKLAKIEFSNSLSSSLHLSVLVKKQLRNFFNGFSWMETDTEEFVFLNEWNEEMIHKMKKVVTKLARSKISEELSTSQDLVKKLNTEAVQFSIYQKFVEGCEIHGIEYIQDDTKKEVRNLLKEISPSFLLSSYFEDDLKCMELWKDPESERSLKFFGFVDRNSSNRYGFGLEFGEFSVGGLFGRNIKCRRHYYGKFNKKGLRHGEKCKEYSPRDGSLIYEGGFKNGQREGKGIEYVLNSTGNSEQVFEGIYRNGKRHGRGEAFENGEIVRGTWHNGILDEGTIFKFECPTFKYSDVKRHLNNSQQVGRGAFGVVYKVKSSLLKQRRFDEKFVAVKIQNPPENAYEEQIVRRMIRRGIGYCYSVQSKHILESYGIIQGRGTTGRIGYVMKLCEKSVDKLIKEMRTSKVTLEEKIRILKETAIGIKALHDHHLIHRDLKWGNVLLDFEGVVKITDFDTVKEEELQFRMNSMAAMSQSKIGTEGFRPPEMINGRKCTFKTDVYAFGLMIYALLFEKNFPYNTRSHCSCGVKMTQIVRNELLEKHICECNLRPLMNPDQVNKFPSFLIDLMVQCWGRSAFSRPSFEDIVFMFKFHGKRKVHKISFQFPLYPGVGDQTMFLIRPFEEKDDKGLEKEEEEDEGEEEEDDGKEKKYVGTRQEIINWIEKKFEKPFEEGEEIEDDEEEDEGEEEKKTKVLRLEHSVVGTIHSDEDLAKIFEHEEVPCLKVTLNFIDESFVLDSVDQKVSLEEHKKVKKRNRDLEKRIKELENEVVERDEELESLRSENERLRNEKKE